MYTLFSITLRIFQYFYEVKRIGWSNWNFAYTYYSYGNLESIRNSHTVHCSSFR